MQHDMKVFVRRTLIVFLIGAILFLFVNAPVPTLIGFAIGVFVALAIKTLRGGDHAA